MRTKMSPGRGPGQWRSALFLLAAASVVAPSCVSGPLDEEETTPILAASPDRVMVESLGQGTCDDGNPCTRDRWDGTSCDHKPEPEGWSCADANVCDGDEICDKLGACVAGKPPELDDDNDCTSDSCDPQDGIVHKPLIGQPCTDQCGIDTTCSSTGHCGAGPLDDGNPCTKDVCDLTLGVVHHDVPKGTSCDDGDVCNGKERCNGQGACTAGPMPPDGTSCSDGIPCNGAEQCFEHRCYPGPPPEPGTPCDDGNTCTESDACDGSSECTGTLAPPGTPCDDGNL